MRSLRNFFLLLIFLGVTTITFASEATPAKADIQLTLSPAHPTVSLDELERRTYLKVGIQGISHVVGKERVPVNVAIVLDRSSSMQGEKIEHAKKAAIMFVNNLSPNDIVSVIAYDSNVEVVVPATKLTDKQYVTSKIAQLQSRGSTALFGGVSFGAAEVRKFLDNQQVNRVLLLSDGQANVGPSSMEEIGGLGESLAKEGITVSTVGLGLNYNEDLMSILAAKGDGRTTFAEQPTDLAGFFEKELRAVTNTIANDVEITVTFPNYIKPVRVMADRGKVSGQTATLTLSSLYQNWENFFIIETDILEESKAILENGGTIFYFGSEKQSGPKAEASSDELPFAYATAKWLDLATGDIDRDTTSVSLNVSETTSLADEKVMTEVVKFKINETNREAIQLADEGNVQQAQQVLDRNGNFIIMNQDLLQNSGDFDVYIYQNRNAIENFGTPQYNAVRKESIEFMGTENWQSY